MTPCIRAPHSSEWEACRMLLPEAFREDSRPEALLAFDETGRVLLGGAAYRWRDSALLLATLRVIRAQRRRGIGSALIRHLGAVAAGSSVAAIRAHVDTLSTPDAQSFLIANGFANRGLMSIAQIDAESALGILLPLRQRLLASGRVPPRACVVPLAEAPLEEVAELHLAHMQSERSLHPAFLRASVYREAAGASSILMVNGRVAGLLLVEVAPGAEVGRVLARVVAPEYRRGWANTYLLAAALERAVAEGVRTVRFEAAEDNLDTVKLIGRLRGEIIQAATRFERPVTLA